MIELNCSYEESKKILELGYDFGNICTKFELRNNDEVKINFGEKISSKTIRSQYTLINDESWFQGKAWIENFVPIIPKAALEVCLPDKLNVKSLDDYVFVNNLDLKTISLSHFFDGYYSCYNEYKSFNSAFEAFTWCHENYPEELKKKFDEVMA